MSTFVLPGNTDTNACHDAAADYAGYVALHPANCPNVHEALGETTIQRMERMNVVLWRDNVKYENEIAELKKTVAAQEASLRDQQKANEGLVAMYNEELARSKQLALALKNECQAYAVSRNEANEANERVRELEHEQEVIDTTVNRLATALREERDNLAAEVAVLRDSLTARGNSAKVIEHEMTEGKRLWDSGAQLSKRVSNESVDVHEVCREAAAKLNRDNGVLRQNNIILSNAAKVWEKDAAKWQRMADEYEVERTEANKREDQERRKRVYLQDQLDMSQQQVTELREMNNVLEDQLNEAQVEIVKQADALSKLRVALPIARAENLRNASEKRKKETELQAVKAKLKVVSGEAQRDDEANAKQLQKEKKKLRELKRLEGYLNPGESERKEKLRKK